MFSVVFWILCSWLPCLADWQVSCSRCVVQLQQNMSPKRLWTRVAERREPEGASTTFWGEMNIVGQIARYFAWQHLVYQAGHLEFNSSSDRQPMKLTRYRYDVLATFGSCDQPCRSILQRGRAMLHRIFWCHSRSFEMIPLSMGVCKSVLVFVLCLYLLPYLRHWIIACLWHLG